MMDFCMVGTLLLCFFLMKRFTDFCEKLIVPKEEEGPKKTAERR